MPHSPFPANFSRRNKKLRVQEAIVAYLAHAARVVPPYCPRALEERRQLLERFCARFGRRLVRQCRPAHLALWIDAHPEWASNWTRARVARTIQQPFNWLYRLGLLNCNPFRGVSFGCGERGRPMEPEEYQALLRATDACFRRVLVFLRFSGARPGEMGVLQWEHMDLVHGWAVLKEHKTARTRRDGRPRVIVLHPVLIKLLAWIRRREPGGRYVFTNGEERPWTRSAIDLRMYRARKRAKVHASCKLYSARHAFATDAVMAGVDLPTVAELLWHTSTRMAEHYVHVAGRWDHLRAAVEKAMA